MNNTVWTTEQIPDLAHKTIIVTGGNSGLGYESVKAFAEKGAKVIMACRSVEKGEAAKAEIGAVKGQIKVMPLDLQDFASIEKFATDFKSENQQLDILLNNAGIMTTPYFKTKDGLEGQMGTNHFGHFKLTSLLLDLIVKTPKSRVVSVSSMAHKQGKMNFDNLMFENGGYSPMKSYGRSKLSNLLFTYELQRKFDEYNIDSIAVAAHPGVASTNLAQYMKEKFITRLFVPLFSLIGQKPAMGALPQIRAAVDETVKGGDYFGPHKGMRGNPIKVESNKSSHNKAYAEKLWLASEKTTKEDFSEKFKA